jgi:hypothetical protein
MNSSQGVLEVPIAISTHFMPLRANSKSIIEKNVRIMAGRPLFAWSLEQAIESDCFDEIYVATDSPKIRKTVSDDFRRRLWFWIAPLQPVQTRPVQKAPCSSFSNRFLSMFYA